MENKQKNRTQTYYILGEMCGKFAVWCTGAAFLSFVSGLICMLLWDVTERKNERKQQQKRK